ncbi:hypothetical protein F6U93_10225 [Tamlana haliotis]|uniref:DUF2127 domain-containing protein n=1 Tax=Pseudotamlana haliotis TaxID=2614804 RepID=A0A6N6MDL9_9FLAO|nr:hypothetical protein [Tamlana haliotis]KAB1067415.1 hypothetical protein F6U93_10225 [Tamlana haliotis]
MIEKNSQEIANEILLKRKIEKSLNKLKIAQLIFIIIGAINIVTAIGIYLYSNKLDSHNPLHTVLIESLIMVSIVSLIIGIIYLVSSAFIKKYPQPIIWTGITIILAKFIYSLYRSGYRFEIGSEFILNILCLIGLGYALYSYYQYKQLIADK